MLVCMPAFIFFNNYVHLHMHVTPVFYSAGVGLGCDLQIEKMLTLSINNLVFIRKDTTSF